jgi:hypothetical protein
MAYGINKGSTMPPGRRLFGATPTNTGSNQPVTSKAVGRYGAQGSKTDFPHSSTGENPAKIHRDELPASAPARHVGHIGPARSEVVGHAPDGSGRWLKATHDSSLIGNAIETHPPLQPQGMSHSATGGAHGKPSKVPVGKTEGYRSREDAGALAGESGPRDSYTGGRGSIKP